MKITIRTKYIPATETKGSKILAIGMGKQKTIPYPYHLSGSAVFIKAAQAWVDFHLSRQGWANTSHFKIERLCTSKGIFFTIK